MNRETTCCFTGHRPDKLPWGENEELPQCLALKLRLKQALEAAYQTGVRHFICGMARGSDLYFAEEVLRMRQERPHITLEAARPCLTQAEGWPARDAARYQKILDQCNYETLVQQTYDRGCMMRRNRYMVDHSALLIAVYDGYPQGGTAQTVAYALRKGLRLDILEIG